MGEIQFNCPDCGGKIAVARNDLGFELPCPHCAKTVPVPWEEIEAAAQNRANIAGSPAPPPPGTPEVVESGFAFPAKLPFFKSSRRKLLQQKCDQLMATNK